jgi:Zn-dependent peptidase ImmA (M78 family)
MEDGFSDLTAELHEPIVNGLRYPIHFYYQRARIEAPSPTFFRRHLAINKMLLKQSVARMNIMKMQIERLLAASEPLECRFPRLDPDEVKGGVPSIAQQVRRLWRIADGPIRNVTQAVESAGCIVIHFDFGTRKIDGCSDVLAGTPIVFLNTHLMPARLRFTLAHEIGHLIMHSMPDEDSENQAHLFAAEFLMPADDIKPMLLPVNLDRLARLKLHWRVSMQALLKRAEDLRLISERTARHWWMIMNKAGYREVEPYENDIPKEAPSLLRELLDMHLQDLGYTTAQLANDLAVQEDEFIAYYNFRPLLRIVA